MFKINERYDLLTKELNQWFEDQDLETLGRIFGTNLYDYVDDKQLLEEQINDLRDQWSEMPLEERVETYNLFELF